MKLFNKTYSYTIVTGEEVSGKAALFAYRHCIRHTDADVRKADDLYAVTFTTRLNRGELANKLRYIFEEAYNVRIIDRVVLITKRRSAL